MPTNSFDFLPNWAIIKITAAATVIIIAAESIAFFMVLRFFTPLIQRSKLAAVGFI